MSRNRIAIFSIVIIVLFAGIFRDHLTIPRFGYSIDSLPRKGQIVVSSGETLFVDVAVDPAEQVRGLSGKPSADFAANQAMLFVYTRMQFHRFWMPDTYFDLDIFFLDPDLKVLHVDRNVPAHPGRNEPPPIAETARVFAQHVLELRADSPLSKKIEVGHPLKWNSSPPLSTFIEVLEAELTSRARSRLQGL